MTEIEKYYFGIGLSKGLYNYGSEAKQYQEYISDVNNLKIIAEAVDHLPENVLKFIIKKHKNVIIRGLTKEAQGE